jgi:hypothetical protein
MADHRLAEARNIALHAEVAARLAPDPSLVEISQDSDIVVIGSQAALVVSMEADLFPMNHPERAGVIDGAIGELSMFHDTFGYYAQGVGEETAIQGPGLRGGTSPNRAAGPGDGGRPDRRHPGSAGRKRARPPPPRRDFGVMKPPCRPPGRS